MTEQSRFIVSDKITPLQNEAWELEHEAIGFKKAGQGIVAASYMEAAHFLRVDNLHEQLDRMDAYSTEQNRIIDIGLGISPDNNIKMVIDGSKPMQRGVDYALMQQ